MNKLAIAAVAIAALGTANIAAVPASAAPITALGATPNENSIVQEVRWVCGPFRCWWQPNYFGYYYFAPRVYYAPAYAPVYGYGVPFYRYRYGPRPFFRVGLRRGWW